MNNREKYLQDKFDIAAKVLSVEGTEIISIKIREVVHNCQDYEELLSNLEMLTNILPRQINEYLPGKGFLIQENENRVIIIEHETGLEILYVAGSIASLVQLIPLLIHLWNGRKNANNHPSRFGNEGVEIQKFDKSGRILEMRDIGFPGNIASIIPCKIASSDGPNSEAVVQIQQLKKQLLQLNRRINNIENSAQKSKARTTKKKKE